MVQFGTGVRAKEIGRPSGGKTGTTNDFTDAWYIGFTPQITTGVWVGNDAHVTLGKKETGARAALPIWIQFMEQGMQGMPVENFRNVVPLEKIAGTHPVQVDTPDTAPPADAAEQGLTQEPAAEPPPSPPAQKPTAAPQPQRKLTRQPRSRISCGMDPSHPDRVACRGHRRRRA